MVFRYRILVLIGLFSSHIGFSQMSIGGQLGVHAGLTKSKSLNEFCDNYNVANAGTFDKSLNNPSFAKGFSANFDFSIGHLYTSIGFVRSYTSFSASFMNGAERHFKLSNQYVSGLIGYIHEGDLFEFTVCSGFAQSFSVLKGYVRYPTKDEDYTYGSVSGIYTAPAFKIPFIVSVGMNIADSQFWWYVKMNSILFSATQSTYYNNINSASLGSSGFVYSGVEVIDDTKQVMLEIGLKYKIDL